MRDQPPSPTASPQVMELVELHRLRDAYVGVPGVSGLSWSSGSG